MVTQFEGVIWWFKHHKLGASYFNYIRLKADILWLVLHFFV